MNLQMTRSYGRAPKGQRVHYYAPHTRGESNTLIGAMTHQGVTALLQIQGSMNTHVFLEFVRLMLLETLHPGDVLVLDNLSAHKSDELEALIASVGARVCYLPPYSPELNPIELCWSKLKEYLRQKNPWTQEDLDRELSNALELITPQNAQAWFDHCGYSNPIT